MAINMRFSDRDIEGFSFGQMTMTGYKFIAVLDKDFPEYGWNENDMIVVGLNDNPCFRIEPLFGAKLSHDHKNKLKSLKHTKKFNLVPLSDDKSEN